MTIKPIETVYDNYRFRSRIEARWAVFFKTLGIPYEYEKEGYDLDGTWYLPDFWLPQQECWVEIKGQEPTEMEQIKVSMLCSTSKHPAYILFGNIEIPPIAKKIVCDPRDIAAYEKARYKCLAFTKHGDQYDIALKFQWEECSRCGNVGLKPYYRFLSEGHLSLLFCECYKRFDTYSIYERAQEIAYLTNYDSPRLIEAYTDARQARFEHQDRHQ